MWRLAIAVIVFWAVSLSGQTVAPIHNASGLRLQVADENTQPTLQILLPDHPDTDRSIEIIFPEHVTAKRHRNTDVQHLYMFRPGEQGDKPAWRHVRNSLEYERDFSGNIHMLARVTLQKDGVLFHYEFVNRSSAAYDMIYAVTDPRLTGMFHDERLERSYVHHKEGFDLLASETPARMTMSLSQWLPARYLASFTWPVPTQRIERRDDGITYYNKSRKVDQPMIATLSEDRQWVFASFSRTTGTVWSNPELTCQHVDPQVSLSPRGTAVMEVKILILKGSLDQALNKVVAQRSGLR